MPEQAQASRMKLSLPRTIADLREWVRERLGLGDQREAELYDAVEHVVARQRQLVEESKREAIRALSEGFTAKLRQLQGQLAEKEITVSNIARYFEEVVAELTEKSHRDPKTKLLNFDWFMERLESFLAVEQRVRWCAVGVVDIRSFKWYNDTLGHAAGDRIIERVARILADQIRSNDMIALERPRDAADLHARFGGDEFCFLIPDIPGCTEAAEIAGRFKDAVERHDWASEEPRLGGRSMHVDVGVVCLSLGPVAARRAVARKLADELIQRADMLMYRAKGSRSEHVHLAAVYVEGGALMEVAEAVAPYPAPPSVRSEGA
jgi:diguanylate cyclase (GGDEF)-like protein